MKDTDRRAFVDLLTATMQVYGAQLGPQAIGIWWAALDPYSLPEVRKALSAHARTSAFSPKPADVIGHIQAADGRPGVEQAWSMVARALGDERATLVLTEEMRAAFFVADGLWDDPVAARMAFRETYSKAVQEARSAGQPIKWGHVLGHDTAGREVALLEAVRLGRLTADHVSGLLPYRVEAPAEVMEKINKRLAA